jgi:hypothetical protein
MREGWLMAGMLLCAALAFPQHTSSNSAQSPGPYTDTYTAPRVIPVRQVDGIVVDGEGLPIPAALIEEYSWDWQNVLASTRTNRDGRFLLVPGAPVRIHYLRVSALGFDILQVRVDEQQKAGTLRLRLRSSS